MKVSRCLGLGLSWLALAVAATACASRATPAGDEGKIMEQQGVSYVSGGDDAASMQGMLAIAAQFNVRLTMVDAERGKPLGGAMVDVASQEGRTVLHATASGPLFYMRLKPGAYRLSVGYQGRDQMRNIVVADEPLDITYRLSVNTLEDDWLLCGTTRCPAR
ncbi:peptidase associated/transthyretin-like domain-containing protein [Cupriavidus campinensis]|uniref:carboxypeptidase regulatory-like domain-containing protein n=1 Tax=Cupriavidus campinensis TaxID=151783 RepID=UPI0011ECDBC9|nr:carboxypeptidase regulatory-like domain-containing protein [Cupriavidus campinensis]